MISVIIPVLNARSFLAEALSSIMAQHCEPTEVLLIDGGSTDGSQAVAAEFPRIRVLNQRGQGLAAARNEGLAHARGEWIAFLDADDFWTTDKLDLQLTALRQDAHCLAVTGHFIRFAHEGVRPLHYPDGWLDHPAPGYTPGALLAHRTLYERVGIFDPELKVGCDSDWFVRAHDVGIEIAVLPQVLLHKRIHADNLSSQVEQYRRELLIVARQSLKRRGVIPGSTAVASC